MTLKRFGAAGGAALSLLMLFHGPRAQAVGGSVQALIRYPSIHDVTVVLEAEGSVWKVPVQGGEAVRLRGGPAFLGQL